jgi:hypothetical protein
MIRSLVTAVLIIAIISAASVSNLNNIPSSLPRGCNFTDWVDPQGYFYEVDCPRARSTGRLSDQRIFGLNVLSASEGSDVRGKDLVKFHEDLAIRKGAKTSYLVDAAKIGGIPSSLFFTFLSETKPSSPISYYTRLGYTCDTEDFDAAKCWELSILDFKDYLGTYQVDIYEIWKFHPECTTVSCLFRNTNEKKELITLLTLAHGWGLEACNDYPYIVSCEKQLTLIDEMNKIDYRE